jgi:plasmid maintenance system antidote protein VapI
VILPAVEGEFLDMRDLAAYSSYSPASLHKMLLHPTHPIPHYRIGGGDEKIGKILVRRSEFDAWLEQWRRAQPPPPDPDKDPEGIVPVAPPEESKPRYLLREHLAAYGLGRVCELQKVLSHSRQQAEAYLSGRCAIGVKVAKKIGEAIGVPFTQVLAWQEESMKAAEAGTPLIPDAPLAKVRSPLCEKLAHYGLDSDVRLARAMKVHRVRAAELLRGGRFGKAVARKIAEAIGGSAEEVLTWQ